MGELQKFERFAPQAWHDRGMILSAPEVPPPHYMRRTKPLHVVVAASILTFGVAGSSSFALTALNGVQIVPAVAEQATQRPGPNLARRIEEIAALRDGWLDGEGVAFQAPRLSRLRSIIDGMLASSDIPIPYLYPTIDGEISAEWTFGDWEVALTFDSGMSRSSALAINTRTREKEEIEVRLDSSNALSRLGRFVESHCPATS